MKRLELDRLDVFVTVARQRSFRGAAACLGVSASTVSQSVRDLEAQLGMRLLNRTTRSVSLTEAGHRLMAELEPALAAIARALDRVGREPGTPAGTLRINAPPPAIDLVLAPMISGFLKAHPQVRVEIIAETTPIDIVELGFDAGVRWEERLAQDVIAVPLSEAQRFAVVASPDLVSRWGRPTDPRELIGRPCIRQRYPSGVTPALEFERDGTGVKIDPGGPLVSTSIAVQKQAALEGIGFWSTFDGYVRDDIAAGRLISVLEDWCPSFPGPFLYYPANRHVPPALRAFVDYVRTQRLHRAKSLAPRV
ncbi:transcriptional regulator [Mesorhizobium sp. L-8-10]|uniref:LysR family transcriptional regulator n=1 Tax=Mesorhizobium sp. L-8-10 TaxID=2744523 RepID=UPI00192736AB|nr:LysR family transcriptional regulator [Mesorhizobium sp. L-8-10]BCH29326.1 transcriptional regulator [Mesorhizobium sp. L-8-10]